MDELLPCPFCGSDDVVVDPYPPQWMALCECGAATNECDSASAAAAAWNRRAPTANAPADPALLALAKMGAMVLGWFECGFPAIPGGVVDDMAVRSGCALEVSDGGGHACWTAPNIRLAIATLLAPDGADGAGEAATDA